MRHSSFRGAKGDTGRLGGLPSWFVLSSAGSILFWGVGQLARDSTWLGRLCFYIPSPILALGFFAVALTFAIRKDWRATIVAASFALPPLGVVILVENHWSARTEMRTELTASHTLRVVHWNVAGHLASGARDVLKSRHADLYVLSEIPDAATIKAFARELGETYESATFGSLAVIGSGRVQAEGWLLNGDGKRVQKVLWHAADREIVLLVVDLPPDVRLHRDPVLRKINELIDTHQPDLVVGDFNAPRRSWGLSELPAGYRHAYATVGSGWGYTWPVPIPVYSLDHCLHSKAIDPIHYVLSTSINSDHRLQVFDFEMSQRAESAGGTQLEN